MKKLLATLAGLYIFGAALLVWLWFVLFRRLRTAFDADAASREITFTSWVPFMSFTIIAVAFAIMCCCLARLLLIRRHRKAAVIMAAVSCLGLPYGPLLGIATLITLNWPDIRAQFTS